MEVVEVSSVESCSQTGSFLGQAERWKEDMQMLVLCEGAVKKIITGKILHQRYCYFPILYVAKCLIYAMVSDSNRFSVNHSKEYINHHNRKHTNSVSFFEPVVPYTPLRIVVHAWGTLYRVSCTFPFRMACAILVLEVISRLVGFRSSWPLLGLLVGVAWNVLMGFLFFDKCPYIAKSHKRFCCSDYLMKHNFVYNCWCKFEFSVNDWILPTFYGHVEQTQVCVSHQLHGGAGDALREPRRSWTCVIISSRNYFNTHSIPCLLLPCFSFHERAFQRNSSLIYFF